jgi:hypothetical protein
LAVHAVRRELVGAQAAAVGVPMIPVMLSYPCTNEGRPVKEPPEDPRPRY